jgi:3-dehydroquinate dehydratase-1
VNSFNLSKAAISVVEENNLHNLSEIDFIDIIEFYVDNFSDRQREHILKTLKKVESKSTILTSRQPYFKQTKYLAEQQILFIEKNLQYFTYIDLDIYNEINIIEKLNIDSRKQKLICSHHNYQKSPNKNELDNIVQQMLQYNPSIIKLAWVCDNEDPLNLMIETANVLKGLKQKFVLSPMGLFGKVGRLVLSTCGNLWVYCSTEQTQTATGQIDIYTYQNWVKMLTNNN